MTYNLTALQGATSIFTVVQASNTFSGGLLMTLFTLSIFFIAIMKFKTYEFSKALLASSVLSFIISLFFVYAKLINPIWSLVYLIIAAFTILGGTLWD
jgi:hypothetical protein